MAEIEADEPDALFASVLRLPHRHEPQHAADKLGVEGSLVKLAYAGLCRFRRLVATRLVQFSQIHRKLSMRGRRALRVAEDGANLVSQGIVRGFVALDCS